MNGFPPSTKLWLRGLSEGWRFVYRCLGLGGGHMG